MAKAKSLFRCQNCAATFPKWMGQCGECGSWNTLVEEITPAEETTRRLKTNNSLSEEEISKKRVVFSQVKRSNAAKQRFSTSIGELDRVLGGGLVEGMVVLLGGEPGIGKSTLLTQMILQIMLERKKAVKKMDDLKIFYVAGEESPSQISLRIDRFLDNEHNTYSREEIGESLVFITTTDADELNFLIKKEKPDLLIVDSIQSLSTSFLTGASGSVGQIREVADRIINTVKAFGIPTFLIGHITKDGVIAGPKVFEHMVDTVLLLEGERSDQLRILRSLKNRFGATDEVGLFQSEDYGLREISNPSELFLENTNQMVTGAATVCLMEGTRSLLAEVQALVVKSQLAMPRRVGRGVDLARIQVLSAVLQKHAQLPLAFYDIFLSVAGGFRIKEASVDLGLAVSIASSLSGKKIPQSTVFIGEIGLLGEIRKSPYFERRAKEARRLGFEKIISRETHRDIRSLLKDLNLLGKEKQL
ncbi:DNA repair protein RadA [Patescibacteria group bacterium]|nr:DNA repair protein RadA [Patescibacteria group bacterium]